MSDIEMMDEAPISQETIQKESMKYNIFVVVYLEDLEQALLWYVVQNGLEADESPEWYQRLQKAATATRHFNTTYAK